MAATLNNICAACGFRHTFFLPLGNTADALKKKYEYECPTTKQTVPLSPSESNWWATVGARPRYAVEVSEVG